MQSLGGIVSLFLPAHGLEEAAQALRSLQLPFLSEKRQRKVPANCQGKKAELLGAGSPVCESQGCNLCGNIFLPNEMVF